MSRVCRCGSTAEQLICNQQVIGSNPIIGFYNFTMDGFPSGQRGQTVNLLATLSKVRILPHPLNKRKIIIAGWSSLEARRAHNPKVVGSNPAPATLQKDIYFLLKIKSLAFQEMSDIIEKGTLPRQLSWQSNGLKIRVSLVRFRFWALFFCYSVFYLIYRYKKRWATSSGGRALDF